MKDANYILLLVAAKVNNAYKIHLKYKGRE